MLTQSINSLNYSDDQEAMSGCTAQFVMMLNP